MANDHDQDLDPITENDDLGLLDDRPGWPKPVGVVSIIFAVLALTCGVLGTGFVFASEPIMASLMGAQLGDVPPPPQTPPPDAIFIASAVAAFALNGLLLFAGVGLLRRRYTVRKLFLAYALFGLIAAGFGVYAQMHGQLQQTKAMDAWVEEHGEKNEVTEAIAAQWEGQKQAAGLTSLIGLGVGIVIGTAWPLFCGIWFGAVKAKPEKWTGVPDADSD